MKLDFTKITEKTAVWCDIEEKAREFIKQAYENGYIFDRDDINSTGYKAKGNQTCYRIEFKPRFIWHDSVIHYKDFGFTIIPFNDLIIKEDKQIADYTIREWQEHCKSTTAMDCNRCKFTIFCAKQEEGYSINEIDLTEKQRFTSEEIEKLKAIRLLFPTAYEIESQDNINQCKLYFEENKIKYSSWLPNLTINSIKQGETINIDEVLKEYGV